jgi:hypothetical protein
MIATGMNEGCAVLATVKDATRRASARWPCRPSLTAAARDAARTSARDEETRLSRTEKHHSKTSPLNLLMGWMPAFSGGIAAWQLMELVPGNRGEGIYGNGDDNGS